MFEGKVKRWLTDYGFIIPDDGSPDLFAHRSAIVGGVELMPGDKLIYRIALIERPAVLSQWTWR